MSTPENEHIENKLSLSEWKEAAISLAAFATAGGGTVRFGIAPDGRRVGVQIGRNTLENLANDIRRSTDPPVFPSITVEGDEPSAVVLVRTEESPIKPVWAFGRPYKRIGRTNQSLSREETLRLMEATTGHTWDALACEGLREEHLSRAAIEDFLRRAGQDPATPTDVVIENLRLKQPDGKLCNAAGLLFAEAPWRFLTGAQVKCGLFRDEVGVDFIDERTLEAPVLMELDEALRFVTRNTRKAIRITGRPEREEIPEYPEEAVREAIINAIIHRDYAAAGNVQIRLFHGRMEVWNPASLPYDVPVESLYETHYSRPRNRKLADAFHRAGLIEQWGTGTLRIVQACEARGLPRPQFQYRLGALIVTLFSVPIEPETSEPTVQASFNERQLKAIAYIREYGNITRRLYSDRFLVSERQALRDMDSLVEHGVLTRVGRGPATRYVLAG